MSRFLVVIYNEGISSIYTSSELSTFENGKPCFFYVENMGLPGDLKIFGHSNINAYVLANSQKSAENVRAKNKFTIFVDFDEYKMSNPIIRQNYEIS